MKKSKNPILAQMLATKVVLDDELNSFPLKHGISIEEGEFIQSMLSKFQCKKTLEIGCAYGVSTHFICDGLKKEKLTLSHTVIDAFQFSRYHGLGINGLKKAGYDVTLIENQSELGLPKLLRQQKSYDFVLIDGFHTFDQALLDFYYVDRLLKVGGIVIFDDGSFPSINRLIRYISKYPAYSVVGSVYLNSSWKKKALDFCRLSMHYLVKIIPKVLTEKIFRDEIVNFNSSVPHNYSMIAFQKISENTGRMTNWYFPF